MTREDVFAIFSDAEVTRHYDLETIVEMEEAYELIDYMAESYATERQVRWGIEHRADAKIVGSCGFVWLRPHSAEIGYDLAKAYWGQGIMHEALTALLDYAFGDLGLKRVEALVMPQNARSKKLLGRLGFTHEGTLREYDHFKGASHDMEMHAILAHDYISQP